VAELADVIQDEIARVEQERDDQLEIRHAAAAAIEKADRDLDVLAQMLDLASQRNGDAPAGNQQTAARAQIAKVLKQPAPPSGSAPKTRESAEQAVAAVTQALGQLGEATQAQLAETTGMKTNRVVTALEKVAIRTGENRKGDRGGRGSPVWRLKSASEGSTPPPVSKRTERSLARAATTKEPTNGERPADEQLRVAIVDALTENGARLGDDLYELVGRPAGSLMAQVMRALIDAKVVRKVARSGHVYYELAA
jgi:hypothetical protein